MFGIALGKYGDEWDNTSANSAEGYVKTIERALHERLEQGNHRPPRCPQQHHLHCEQAGIVGSLGAMFSVVTGNDIHDIHVRRLFSGAEMAGIKFHGAIDVEISRNHIYRTFRGVWLDWMAQGARVSANLFHENRDQTCSSRWITDRSWWITTFSFPDALLVVSQGGVYVHNLIAGGMV